MSRSSTIPAAMDALVDGLKARPALAGVQIASAQVGLDATAHESIQFGDAAADQEWASAIKRSRDESYTVSGFAWVVRAGADEDVIRAARGRVWALVDELVAMLWEDPTLGGRVRTAQVREPEFSQGVHPDGGRVAMVRFEVEIAARLSAP